MSIPHACHACLRAVVVGALTAAALAAVDARADDALEQARVKAAFVLNFMKFTAWPEQHATDSGTLTLCATERHPLEGQLHSLEGRDVRGLRVVHRVGALAMGDQIVLVAVTSAHRQAAFACAEFLMDWLKTEAPFWKKESVGGVGAWVEARDTDVVAAQRWHAQEDPSC